MLHAFIMATVSSVSTCIMTGCCFAVDVRFLFFHHVISEVPQLTIMKLHHVLGKGSNF